jgi:DNA repair exonuclease SbcCD ATPase subunit
MGNEMTAEELGQIIRAARVLATDFSEEQIQSLSYAWQRLADSGFLDAVWGMVRLQEEQGISCPEALDANRELLKQKERLESELAILKDKIKQEQNKHSEATKIYQQLVSKINAAKNELQAIQSDTKAEVVLISSIQEKAEKERRRIEKELERCKKNAGITAEEIAVAAKLKTEVEKSGFNLETMLGLVQEFVPYQDARERLAGVLKNSQSLTEHISTLEQRSAEKKKDIAAAIDRLVSQQNSEQSNVNQLKELHRQLENSVARLQADLDGEQGLRQFYIRYRPLSDLLEYLVSWKQVYFLRCDNPMCAPFAGITRFWTDKPVRKCPYCGLSLIKPDPEPFRLLNMTEGTEFQLRLG